MSVKNYLRQLTPKPVLGLYHGLWSYLGAAYYRFPSKKLVTIGVTGTNGKSTTVNLLAKALESTGQKVALTSTVNFKIGDREWLNDLKMTTPGRHWLNKFLREAVKAGCKYAVLETSSEALVQNRHWGIYYDVAVFTNLTPEHIDSHGSFYNYQAAKKILFDSLNRRRRKIIDGSVIPTVIVANSDDPHAPYYLSAKSDRKITYGLSPSSLPHAHLKADDIAVSVEGVKYKIVNDVVQLKLKGHFDVYNSLAALAVCQMLDVDFQKAQDSLSKVEVVPGRLEIIQDKPFMVLVDYAPEPESMRQLYNTLKLWGKTDHIIHVLGSTGGGRDVGRRRVLGEIAADSAEIVIITNEDPYDDDPQKIIDDVAGGAEAVGKILKENLFKIIDRREAIRKAILLAKENYLVLVTGKGAEQKMAVASGKYIDWDDRSVIREELNKIS